MEFIENETALRELFGHPSERALAKDIGYLDEAALNFLADSPFYVLATADAEGRCDATPRGEDPGSFLVLDPNTLVLPERPGNKRLDSLSNLLVNPEVGLLFLIPGSGTTLRVNGRARILSDAPFFEELAVGGKPPLAAILVEVREVYLHCPKAFVRSRLWQSESWLDGTPSLGSLLRQQLGITQADADSVDDHCSVGNRAAMF